MTVGVARVSPRRSRGYRQVTLPRSLWILSTNGNAMIRTSTQKNRGRIVLVLILVLIVGLGPKFVDHVEEHMPNSSPIRPPVGAECRMPPIPWAGVQSTRNTAWSSVTDRWATGLHPECESATVVAVRWRRPSGSWLSLSGLAPRRQSAVFDRPYRSGTSQ